MTDDLQLPENQAGEQILRRGFQVGGTVQGVGFRPFVYAVATSLGLHGFVSNSPSGVIVEVEGPPAALTLFEHRIQAEAPQLASITTLVSASIPITGQSGFQIAESRTSTETATAAIPPDLAVCTACEMELRDPADRRYGYPFIACMHCGPRFTMTVRLPYDRENTTMSDFPLCAQCLQEYHDPSSRRFHAQPTACPDCGPQLSITITEVVAALVAGKIVAIKGIGGYHLVCDARNSTAVDRLRAKKQRGNKPFAVMAASLTAAGSVVDLTQPAAELLGQSARPILVLPAHDHKIAESLAPNTHTLGVMLPYAPLHLLLFDHGAPELLVMTSGNLADEPICVDPKEAEDRLGSIADLFCHHNRRIHVACDDSVLSLLGTGQQPIMLRRSRGYAPAPLQLRLTSPSLLAVGGELKTVACLAHGNTAWLSQHLGDCDSFETQTMLDHSTDTLAQLQRIDVRSVVCDAHPGYQSRRWAINKANKVGAELVEVFHHHAHLASLLAEHQVLLDQQVLGVIFDGTGFGPDHTIWGGEFLYGSYQSVQRVAHLRPILLAGGDATIAYPIRAALAHLVAAGLPWHGTNCEDQLTDQEINLIISMIKTERQSVVCTSIGRLFDAISALLGVCQHAEYEGQAAIELEAIARSCNAAQPWPSLIEEHNNQIMIDPTPWLAKAIGDRQRYRNTLQQSVVSESSYGFHAGLAEAICNVVARVATRYPVQKVGLSGGVFANTILTELTSARLTAAGFTVLTHRVVPPNDGGLALGQAAIAAAHHRKDPPCV